MWELNGNLLLFFPSLAVVLIVFRVFGVVRVIDRAHLSNKEKYKVQDWIGLN